MVEKSEHLPWHHWKTGVALGLFFLVWLLIARRWARFPVGRTAGALVGAIGMVQFQIITAGEANQAIELSTLLLLLGLMIILSSLEAKGLVEFLTKLITFGNVTPLSLLVRISLFSGCLSAIVMNDGAALFLSLVVKNVCSRYDLPLAPYLIAMATSANIGSAATVVGNPKNMVIHFKAKLGFLQFLQYMGPPAAVGLIINTFFLILYFNRSLSPGALEKGEAEEREISSPSPISARSDSDETSKPKKDKDKDKTAEHEEEDEEEDDESPQLIKQAKFLAPKRVTNSTLIEPIRNEKKQMNENIPLLPSKMPPAESSSTPTDTPPFLRSQSLREPAFVSPSLPPAAGSLSLREEFSQDYLYNVYLSPKLGMSGSGKVEEKETTTRYGSYGRVPTRRSIFLPEHPHVPPAMVEMSPGSEVTSPFSEDDLQMKDGQESQAAPKFIAENNNMLSHIYPGPKLNLYEMFDFNAMHTQQSDSARRERKSKAKKGGIAESESTGELDRVDEIWMEAGLSQTKTLTNRGGSSNSRELKITVPERKSQKISEPQHKLKSEPKTHSKKSTSLEAISRCLVDPAYFSNFCVGLLILGMYAGFLLGFDLGWTCLGTAILIILFDHEDPAPLFAEINWELLLYLIGLFVTIKGINKTPLPGVFWNLISPLMAPGKPLHLGVFGFSVLVMMLCMIFTSIPCVLLVSPHLGELHGSLQHFAWLLLAWAVTLSGNLTVFSSVAGVIASEAAGSVQPITFFQWFKYAFPTTVVVLAVGAAMLSYIARGALDSPAIDGII